MTATNMNTFYDVDAYDFFGEFLINESIKHYWTAFFILCMYWGFFWFARHILNDQDSTNHPLIADINLRIHRTAILLQDLVVLLLSALVINTMSRGGTQSVMILSWIYVGLAVLCSLYELLYSNHLVRLVYSILLYGICITIGGIAFKNGFDRYD